MNQTEKFAIKLK